MHALNDVSAKFYPGEVVAVMGENGAGKSTLMKVLGGIHVPDSGEILLNGQPVTIPSVRRAEDLGIAFIHQELNLADNLTVSENVFLGREPCHLGPLGWIDQAEIRRRTVKILEELGMSFSPDTRVAELSIGHQQMVEIAKSLSKKARLLVMDEPTSSLSQHETDRLFDVVRKLRDDGMGVVFISHRMAEVQAIAERVIVLRDGKNSGELSRAEISRDRIVSLMVGRDLALPGKRAQQAGKVVLQVRDLVTPRFPKSKVSFELKAGEITGMAGLVGAGRTELVRAIFGIDKALSGQILLDNKELEIGSPKNAIKAGLAFVPENRKEEGVIVEMAIRDNLAMAGLDRYQRASFVSERRINEVAESSRRDLSIRAPSIHKEVGLLSGGNQQKVVLGKWISLQPRVLLLDEPTRGVDVGSKSEIYQVVERMAEAGAAILFISSEMEEVIRISDRVLVMYEGRLVSQVESQDLREETIMRFATGQA